jgi:hypothetical protein
MMVQFRKNGLARAIWRRRCSSTENFRVLLVRSHLFTSLAVTSVLQFSRRFCFHSSLSLPMNLFSCISPCLGLFYAFAGGGGSAGSRASVDSAHVCRDPGASGLFPRVAFCYFPSFADHLGPFCGRRLLLLSRLRLLWLVPFPVLRRVGAFRFSKLQSHSSESIVDRYNAIFFTSFRNLTCVNFSLYSRGTRPTLSHSPLARHRWPI